MDFDLVLSNALLASGANIVKSAFERILREEFVVDVRESWERPELDGVNVLNAPLDDLCDKPMT